MIKFRAWDNDENQYLIDGNAGTLANLVCSEDLSMMNPDDYIWEQFTGLKDVNGMPIYEGDIVHAVREYNYDRTGKVIFDNGAYMLDNGIDRELLNPILGAFTVLSIVGNVHENPGLLEADK